MRHGVMANVRVWVRESVGLVLSGVFTAALFGSPVIGLVGQIVTDLDLVEVQHERLAVVLQAPLADELFDQAPELGELVADTLEADAAADPDAPEPHEPPEEQGSEGMASADASGGGGADAGSEPPGEPVLVAREDLRRKVSEGRARRLVRPDAGQGSGDAALAMSEVFDEAGADAGGRKRGSKARCTKEIPEIVALSDGSFTVERELVEYYTSSFSRLNSLGWSGKYDEGDEKGWKISGFGCNSPLYRAGLRRGDVIQSVNGRNTKNILQVYTTWKKLRKMDDFEIVLLRRGEIVRLTYRLI